MSWKRDVWDLAVVGGGTAGIVAAQTASSLGASVVLIERDRTGGDCLWTGCVPSKSLIAAASAASQARRSSGLGIAVSGVAVDFSAVMGHVRSAIAAIEPVDSPESLQKAGVKVLHGTGTFTAPGVIGVDDRSIRFRQALLAMGAAPAIPPIPGLAETHFLTSDSIWSLDHLPKRLAVLGAGSGGCELGQAFARLGSDVTVVDEAANILPREDPHAAAIVARSMATDGVRVLTGRSVTEIVGKPDGGGDLVIGTGSDESRVEFDQLLVAVGRNPRTAGLGLERVGVETDRRGYVKVSREMRSTNKHIWAAGDLTDQPQFTHTAGVNGSLAASNAVLGLRRKREREAVPRVTFTDPEIAAVGRSTAGSSSADISIVTHANNAVDRAITERNTNGTTRLAVDRRGRILGATIVGPRAGESISELTLAVQLGLRTKDIASMIHPYPTYSDGVWLAAIDDFRVRLQQPTTAKMTGLLRRFRKATLNKK